MTAPASPGYEFLREDGLCAIISPDGSRICIKDAGHEDRHGWEAVEPVHYRIEGEGDRRWLVFRTWRETVGAHAGALLLSLIYDEETQSPFDVRTMYSDDPRLTVWEP